MDGESKVNDDMNKALLGITSARGVLTFFEWSSGEFDVTNAVTALHRMARAPDKRFYTKDSRWPSVIGKAHQMIKHTCTNEDAWPRLSKEYLLNAAWSFSVLGHRDDGLFDCICDEIMKKPKELNPHDMSGLTRALANLKIQSESVMDRILGESRGRMGQFRPPNLASLSWSLATLAWKDDDMMDLVSKETINKVRLFQPKHLHEVAWAFATLGLRKPALNGALTDATIGRIEEFQPRELAGIVHSFAVMTAGSEAVMEVIADKLSMRMQDLDPDTIEKVAWAFGTDGFVDEAMMSSLVTEVLNRLEEFTAQHLSVISWAFATLDIKEELLIDAMKNFISLRLDAFRAVDLAKMIPAFVKWGARDEVEGDLYMAAMNKMSKFGPRDLASVAEAYETYGDPELLCQFLEGASYRFSTVSEYASAENWVKFTTLIARHADEATKASFEPKFVAAILRPLLTRLKDVYKPGGSNGQRTEAVQALQEFVSMTQLEHLGPYYTRHALLGQYMPMLSADIIEHPDFQQVAQGDSLVAASWELQWRRNWWVEPFARLFADGVPRSGSKFLPPLAGMKAGAGRNALLHAASVVMKRCPEEKLPEVMGCVRVVATQFPGIDALAALCQFRHYFASVRLEVDYVG
mmetsp:Transcript_55597/g.156502  ORF Transcript_55597/g.156502 Transcript_55597/m.156502 type:complete len:635 (+) Transcript_55597:116-2020(+)